MRDRPQTFWHTMGSSAAVHGTLMVVLMVVSLFQGCMQTRRPREVITMVDMSSGPPPSLVEMPIPPPPVPPPPEPPKPKDDIPEDLAQQKPKPPKIQVQTNKVVRRQPTPAPKPLSSADIKKALGAGPKLSGLKTSGDITVPSWYLAQVRNSMYEAWAQPSGLVASGLSVDAEIRVQKDGRVTERRMLRRSGNGVMDRSVEDAMAAVDRLPRLPSEVPGPYLDIPILFKLDNSIL